jgi:hypothetical protein
LHQLRHQWRDILRQAVRISGIVGDMNLADPGDLRGLLGDAVDALAGDQQMDFAKLRCGGYGAKGGVFQLAFLMLD